MARYFGFLFLERPLARQAKERLNTRGMYAHTRIVSLSSTIDIALQAQPPCTA